MAETLFSQISRQVLPLEVNSVAVRTDGSLEMRETCAPVAFRFSFLGHDFAGAANATADGALLSIGADLLPLPYSIESHQRRQRALALLRATRDLPHTRLVATPAKIVRAEGRLPVARPLTTGRLIGATTVLLLELLPYLALVAEFLEVKRPARGAA
jgi:hypothetical protein